MSKVRTRKMRRNRNMKKTCKCACHRQHKRRNHISKRYMRGG